MTSNEKQSVLAVVQMLLDKPNTYVSVERREMPDGKEALTVIVQDEPSPKS
jgi:hypothetical protein